MEDETQRSIETIIVELDPAQVERELASFQSVLDLPIVEERLDGWLEDSAIRKMMFANTVWGTIRWPKSLGRPLSHTLASAFVIDHVHWDSIPEFYDGGIKYIQLLAPHPEPSKWDGPDDENFHRVSFMAQTPQRQTQISVKFTPHVAWNHIGGSVYRHIDSPQRRFLKDDGAYVLKPFEVISAVITGRGPTLGPLNPR
jgi:hypothetical protein